MRRCAVPLIMAFGILMIILASGTSVQSDTADYGYTIDYYNERVYTDEGYRVGPSADGPWSNVYYVTPGVDVYVCQVSSDGTTTDPILVEIPERPAAPDDVSMWGLVVEIDGLQFCEYGSDIWYDPLSKVFDEGVYQARYSPTDSSFGSEPVTFLISDTLTIDGYEYALTGTHTAEVIGSVGEPGTILSEVETQGWTFTVTSIYTVNWNSEITEVIVPNSVTNIDDNAFSDCVNLKSAYIPDSVTSLGEGIFAGCSSLTEVRLPDGIDAIPGGMFSGTAISDFTIPDTVTSIGDWAFSYCYSLSSITIPSSVTYIGEGAFSKIDSSLDIYFESTRDNVDFGENCFTSTTYVHASGWDPVAEIREACPGYVIVDANDSAPELGEGFTIDYLGEYASRTSAIYEISTSPSGDWDSFTEVEPGGTLYVRYAGESEYTANPIPDRPEEPSLTLDGNVVRGLTTAIEWSVNQNNWNQCTSSTYVFEFAQGEAFFRYAAVEGVSFKSDVCTIVYDSSIGQEVELSASVPDTFNLTEGSIPITFTNTGEVDVSLVSVRIQADTTAMSLMVGNYAILSSGEIDSSWYIVSEYGLTTGEHTITIYADYYNHVNKDPYSLQCEVTVEVVEGRGTDAPLFDETGTDPETGEVIFTIYYDIEEIASGYWYELSYTDDSTTGEDRLTISPGQTVYVRQVSMQGEAPSDWAEIHIEDRPAAPTVEVIDASSESAYDGSITGVSAEMEYRPLGDVGWFPCTGDTVENLAPGTYEVRYAAVISDSFASESSIVTIGYPSEEGGLDTIPIAAVTVVVIALIAVGVYFKSRKH